MISIFYNIAVFLIAISFIFSFLKNKKLERLEEIYMKNFCKSNNEIHNLKIEIDKLYTTIRFLGENLYNYTGKTGYLSQKYCVECSEENEVIHGRKENKDKS